MNIIELIDKKRQGKTLTEAEIRYFVQGVVSGEIPDYQVSAWLMAACIQGLNLDETTWLTHEYVLSGQTLDLSSVGGIVVDKHSTGGVGDKTTLILAPLLAVSGVKVAKLSGRGLGFTGGTIDKLEAIPGFQVSLSTSEFVSQIREIGTAICSQTEDLAPADGKIYALRDVTATVASIPLIAASVVSKKIAAGAQVIVLDIKAGRGAFMKDIEEARQLAETCRLVGKRLGKNISTAISSMDQPLGYAIGNSLEVIESVKTLKGEGPRDLESLCLTLGAMALVGAGKFHTLEEATCELQNHLKSGEAFAKLKAMVKAQGGDPQSLEDFSRLPQPTRIVQVFAQTGGYIANVDSLKVAEAAKVLGAGRLKKGEPINLGVGVYLHKKVGNAVQPGESLADLYVAEKGVDEAVRLVEEAFLYSKEPVSTPPILDEIYYEPSQLATI